MASKKTDKSSQIMNQKDAETLMATLMSVSENLNNLRKLINVFNKEEQKELKELREDMNFFIDQFMDRKLAEAQQQDPESYRAAKQQVEQEKLASIDPSLLD